MKFSFNQKIPGKGEKRQKRKISGWAYEKKRWGNLVWQEDEFTVFWMRWIFPSYLLLIQSIPSPFEWIPLIKICLVCAPHRFYFCLHLLIIRTGRDLFDSRHPFDACWQETQDHVDHEKIIRFPGKEIPRPNPGSNLFFTQPTGSKKGLLRVETLWKKRPCEKEREKRWSWNMILKNRWNKTDTVHP